MEPFRRGQEVWVAYINRLGGLNGHPVKLIVYDDGGDPARYRAAVQDAIERQKVITLFGAGDAVSGRQGTTDYITSQRVPVVGVDGGEALAYSSPMYFPQIPAGPRALARIVPRSIAPQLIPKGTTKLGSVVCVESPICDVFDQTLATEAKSTGFEHVYRGRASLAQPDFTAECLSARNAGVQVFAVILDQNSVTRVGAACARQGYHPIYAFFGQVAEGKQKDDPNLVGSLSQSLVFPYFQLGTPATDEFQRALRDYGQGVNAGVPLAIGWTAGKLLEKAGSALPEPPTKEAVLAGLWSLKEETLGGLTAPLTFVKDQRPQPFYCWFDMTLERKGWSSPDGYRLHCE